MLLPLLIQIYGKDLRKPNFEQCFFKVFSFQSLLYYCYLSIKKLIATNKNIAQPAFKQVGLLKNSHLNPQPFACIFFERLNGLIHYVSISNVH